jgi:CheY-like chemotaxis protein
VLIRYGHTVKEAFYGAEVMKTKGEYGLLFSDICMPGIDGV